MLSAVELLRGQFTAWRNASSISLEPKPSGKGRRAMLGIKKLSAVVGAAVVAAVSTYASASTFSFDGSSASNTAYAFNGGGLTVAQVATLKASVSFTLSGNNLVVDITNLQSVATVGGAEIAGVFWDSNTIVGGLLLILSREIRSGPSSIRRICQMKSM